MSWSKDYKKSIDCDNPKGFSQRAHCDARKKRIRGEKTKSKSPFYEKVDTHDEAVKTLENQLKNLKDISYDSIDELMRSIMKKYDITAKDLHNAFVSKHNKTPDDWIKDLNEGTLHQWFKGSKSKDGKPGWVQSDGSPCANEPGETKTPKCFSSSRLRALKKKGKTGENLIRSAVRRKRQKDKNQQEKTGSAKPTNVPTFAKGKKDKNYIKAEPSIKESMELNEFKKDTPGKGSGKKDACYHKVKSRYDVWPSAYASGALVKCRQVGAKNWGTKSEDCWDGYKQEGMKKKGKKLVPNCVPIKEEEMIRYCPKCKKDETRSECKYGTKFWDMYSMPITLKKYTPNTPHPGNFPESYDHEYSMARSELATIASAVKRLKKKMKGEGNIEAWVQSKITKAADYLDSAADYIDSGEMKVESIEGGPILPKEKGKRVFPKGQEPKPTGAKLPPLQNAHYELNGELVEYSNWRKEFNLKEFSLPGTGRVMAPKGVELGFQQKFLGMNVGKRQVLPLNQTYSQSSVNRYNKNPNAPSTLVPMTGPGPLLGRHISIPKQKQTSSSKPISTSSKTNSERMVDAFKGTPMQGIANTANKIDRRINYRDQPKEVRKMLGLENYLNSKTEIIEDWQKVNRQDKTDGMSQKAVNTYRKENPGSKLKTAVTEKNPGPERKKRRKNYCDRSEGQMNMHNIDCSKDPDKPICKARRRWRCN